MKTWSTVAVGGGVTVTLIFCLQFAPLLLSSSHHEIHHVSEEELNKIERYATSTTTTTMNLPHDRNLATTPSKTCVQGYAGDDLSTVNPFPKPMVIDPLRPLNYCGEFDGGSCCSNIMAQEITDAFVHLMDVGGTGGVPIDEERCLQYAKKTFIALKDYFCLMCNPRHIQYFGCCYDKYKIGGNCIDPLGLATTDQLMQKYGEGTCINKASDTIRICQKFANKLWGKDGSKYDQCGMMTWVMHREDIVATENAWSDDDNGDGTQDGNPGGIVPWGDVDGRTGELLLLLFVVCCLFVVVGCCLFGGKKRKKKKTSEFIVFFFKKKFTKRKKRTKKGKRTFSYHWSSQQLCLVVVVHNFQDNHKNHLNVLDHNRLHHLLIFFCCKN